MTVSDIPALSTKKSWFLARDGYAHDRRRREPIGGSWGMLPREKIKDMCLQDAISYILRSHLMENSGVFFSDFLIEKT